MITKYYMDFDYQLEAGPNSWEDERLCIAMEYCDGGDLREKITKCIIEKTPMTENAILMMFTQISLAV